MIVDISGILSSKSVRVIHAYQLLTTYPHRSSMIRLRLIYRMELYHTLTAVPVIRHGPGGEIHSLRAGHTQTHVSSGDSHRSIDGGATQSRPPRTCHCMRALKRHCTGQVQHIACRLHSSCVSRLHRPFGRLTCCARDDNISSTRETSDSLWPSSSSRRR